MGELTFTVGQFVALFLGIIGAFLTIEQFYTRVYKKNPIERNRCEIMEIKNDVKDFKQEVKSDLTSIKKNQAKDLEKDNMFTEDIKMINLSLLAIMDSIITNNNKENLKKARHDLEKHIVSN